MSHKLYMAMRNMLSLAIPGMDWTDDIGRAALDEAKAAMLDHENALARVMEWPNPSKALIELFRLQNRVSPGEWVPNLSDGTVHIPSHNTVCFDDGYDAAFCAGAKNCIIDFMQYLGRILDRLTVLQRAKMEDATTIAKQQQTIAAQEYVIRKLDDIVYAVQHPDLLRFVAEIDARQAAEARVTELENYIREHIKKEDSNA